MFYSENFFWRTSDSLSRMELLKSNKLIFPPLQLKGEVKDFLKLFFSPDELDDILFHLGNPPPFTSIRINTIKSPSVEEAIVTLKKELSSQSQQRESQNLNFQDYSWDIFKHEKLNDCIIIPTRGPFEINPGYAEVYVDTQVFSSVFLVTCVFKSLLGS